MKILMTGFEPFGGERFNPSLEAVLRLAQHCGTADGKAGGRYAWAGDPSTLPSFTLRTLALPVVFGEAARILWDAVREEKPAAILCLGQAGGRKAITPEKVAINLQDARIPDNQGQSPVDLPIFPDGDKAYFSTLPVRRMVEQLKEAKIPAEISYSAGTYVCNDLFYSLMYHLHRDWQEVGGAPPLGGFIHVPYETSQLSGKPEGTFGMDMATMVQGLEICVLCCREALL